MLRMNVKKCHCGREKTYRECCGRVMKLGANTPEELMRSRYSAFVEKKTEYLIKTHHPLTRHRKLAKELKQNTKNLEWLSLHVIESRLEGDEGQVEFVAYARQGARFVELHERSVFLREKGVWYYVSGETLPFYPRGLNEPCWCGCDKTIGECLVIS